MQSIRRAALRASCSALRVAAPKQQMTPFAMQISQKISRPAMTQLFPRQFSSDSAPESSPTLNEENLRQGHPLYIGNMSFDATETHIHEAFGKYGEILSVNIPRDARGLARGFAFVNFKDESAIEAAVDGANQSFWHGRRIVVQARTQTSSPREKRRADNPTEPTQYLYIGNIPYETSDADLNSLFRSLDGVRDVRIAIDRNTGWPRGFAHCDFESVEAAEAAKEKISQYKMGTRTLRADYSFAPKSPRDRAERSNSLRNDRD